jgi:hypothetical protein
MNIALDRLIEGIIATLRTDVIPHVRDSYARGQAVGVIDLLNNIGARIEWMQEPLRESVRIKRELLGEVGGLVPDRSIAVPGAGSRLSAEDLIVERVNLDAAIGDALKNLHDAPAGENRDRALALLCAHLHDEQVEEMKKTRKPLFAEIASGSAGKRD